MKKEDYSESRYSRFVVLPSVGIEGMKNIRKAKVTIVGAGGLGSVTATQLTALGVGYIRLFDNDIIEKSNLQRQSLYREKDVGKTKVKIAKEFLSELNPDVKIDIFQEEITEKNAEKATTDVDFVVDALDKFTPRFALNKLCLEKDIPFLFGAVSGMSGNTMTVIRGGACIECLFGHVKDEALPSNLETGVHPSILQIVGSLQVAEATRLMLNKKPLLKDKLQFVDIESMFFDCLNIKPKTDCPNRSYH